MSDRKTLLASYLSDVAGKPFEFGKSDCGIWLADWLILILGCRDPIVEFRNHYSTPTGWLDISGKNNLAEAINDVVGKLGLERTDKPLMGDIGVLDLPLIGQVGAIMGSKGWIIRLGFAPGEPGVASLRFSPRLVSAWRV